MGECIVLQELIRSIHECGMEKFGTRQQRENDRYPRRYMVATDGETRRGQSRHIYTRVPLGGGT